MVDFSLWDIFRNLLLAGRWTVALSLVAFVGGGLVGLGLLLLRLAKLRGAETGVSAFVQLFQGTPLLMQLFLAYFGLALFGINVSAWVAAAVALTLYTSAFLAEIWRGCVAAIPKGQWEAADSLALSFGEKMRHVIGPQALRIALPAMTNEFIALFKNTTLVLIVSIFDLLGIAQAALADPAWVGMNMEAYVFAGAIYWIACFGLSQWSRLREKRLQLAHGR